MSRAIVFEEPGGPEVLRLADVAEPQAGPGQVRVMVRAAGVQPFDVAVVEGWLPAGADAAYPRTPGNEFAGVIDRLGEGVTGFAVGDEVLGFTVLNAYREHLVIPSEQVTAKPPGMPWEVAGGFTAPAQTAYNSLEELEVGEHDTLLVHGAAGAVGTVAVQLGRLWGATVIGAARETQHDYLRSLGALPVDYGDGFTGRVRELAPNGVVTAALDGVGGTALDATLELVEDRSRIITLYDHDRAAALGVRLSPARRTAARLADMVALYTRGEVKWHIHRTFPLERAADAHRAYKAGGIRGKIVLTVD
ncbi:quinone oxidoreductase family protein [Actinomadura macra]|uniref:quinone oxidoreductase family protein n=1 Tax=Actinomadura macra TaxID=46164 RepID=UPI00082F1756|nr:NADP-dependent oxidoreductase [Actinomadura macra]